jgi:hypothetical protein
MWLELRVDIGDILRQLFAFLGLSSLRGPLSLAGHLCELHVQLNGERKPIIVGHLATGRAVVLPIQSLRGLEAEKRESQWWVKQRIFS